MITSSESIAKYDDTIEFIQVDMHDSVYAYIPGNFNFNNNLFGIITIPLALKIKLTEEELKKGAKLCRLEEAAKKWGSQQESLRIFHETCQLLEFDYKEAIEIQREKEILDILKEAQVENGSLFVVRGDASETYYALSKEDAYVWDSVEKIIRSVSQNHLPLHIREDIQELKEKREPR